MTQISIKRRLLVAFVLAFVFAIHPLFISQSGADESEDSGSSSPLLRDHTKTSSKAEVNTLPSQLTEDERFFDHTDLQMPVSGEHIGKITRQSTVFEKGNTFSVVFPYLSTIKTADDEPFTGVLHSPEKLFYSSLPQPEITGASIITAASVTADAEVSIYPPAVLRIPLPEAQQSNDDITVYMHDAINETWQIVDYERATDGSGIIIQMPTLGVFAVFDGEGDIGSIVPPTPEDPEDMEEAASETGGGSATGDADPTESADEETTDDSDETEADDEIDQESNDDEDQSEDQQPISTDEPSGYVDLKNHWAEPYAAALKRNDLSLARSAMLFDPNVEATRAELVAMLVQDRFEATEIESCIEAYMPSRHTPVFFTDVTQFHKHANSICMAAINKMVKGFSDGSFAPDAALTRAEALKLLYDMMPDVDEQEEYANPFADVSSADWFAPAVLRAAATGVVKGFTISPEHPAQLKTDYIGRDSSPEMITKVQQFLTETGFYTAVIDGRFRDELTQSVLLYQLSRGVVSSPAAENAGVLDATTISRIDGEILQRNGLSQTQTVFRPHQKVTRAELAKFAAIILELQ